MTSHIYKRGTSKHVLTIYGLKLHYNQQDLTFATDTLCLNYLFVLNRHGAHHYSHYHFEATRLSEMMANDH